MAMIERKGLIFTAIAVALVSILTGLFLGGDLLPSRPAGLQEYAERTTQAITKTIVPHAHDGLPMHQHWITTVVTTTETTPHGDFYDFAAAPPPAQQGSITAETTPAPIPVPGPNEIWILGREFRPSSLTVPVGTKVTWTNKDAGDQHTVTSDTGLFNGTLSFGESFNYTFTKSGIFSYHCEIHPGMAGTVMVE